MRPARFLIGVALALSPAVCFAQESGSGDIATDSGSMLRERLAALAEGGTEIEALMPSSSLTASWAAEVERYRERSTELRNRCHEEIRRANRDTIVEKAAQCLRSDLLLEIGHRRKQRDILAETPGVSLPPSEAIDAWIDAATAVVDGIDAGVFSSIDMLKEAKRNLHATYRRPMLLALALARISYVRSVIASVASVAHDAERQLEESQPFLETIVPCLEEAHAARGVASAATTHGDASLGLTTSIEVVRRCIGVLEELSAR